MKKNTNPFLKKYSRIKSVDIDDIAAIEKQICKKVVKLSRNENIFGPPPSILNGKYLNKEELTFYPELEYPDFQEILGVENGLEGDNIFLVSGTDEAIYYFSKSIIESGDKVSLFEKTFRSYETAFLKNNAIISWVKYKDRRHDIYNHDFSDSKIVVIVSPNMPTGEMYSKKDIEYIISKMREDAVLILDFAYVEFTDFDPKDISKLIQKKNVIITRTFSKFYALAGLRIGYIVASKDIIKIIKSNIRRLSISSVSFNVARDALKEVSYYSGIKTKNRENMDWFLNQLDSIGVTRHSGNGNFVLIEHPKSEQIFQELLSKHGILIRKYESKELRITIGTKEHMVKIIEVIKDLSKGIN